MMEELAVFCAESPAEKERLREFVDRAYRRVYHTTPPGADVYVGVRRGENIRGCIGLEYAGQDGFFPIEKIYRLERHELPLPITDKNSVQFSRLVAVERGITAPVGYAATCYSLTNARVYGLLEHGEAVHKILLRLGVKFWPIPVRGVDLQAVAPHNRDHYASGKLLPYLVELAQVAQEIRKRLPSAVLALFCAAPFKYP